MLVRALSALIDRVQVSSCVETADGRFRKVRRRGTGPLIAAGNLYMRLADARISMFVRADDWLAHELSCLRLAHPELACARDGPRSFVVDRLPGAPLRSLAARGPLDPRALFATGEELRRCHALDQQSFAHGDPHLANVLWDGTRARLIDFETPCLPHISIVERRANDLLVVLLELAGTTDEPGWPGLSRSLVQGYAPTESVREALGRLLAPPTGLARVLWAQRSKRAPWPSVRAKIAALRASL